MVALFTDKIRQLADDSEEQSSAYISLFKMCKLKVKFLSF